MKKPSTSLILLIGVAICRAETVNVMNQSEDFDVNDQPTTGHQIKEGQRQIETPEVVLQIKYDKGELNKIYLAQFRKTSSEWVPSVTSRTNLCSDLCYAGLGGATCGSTCQELVPVGLKSTLQEYSSGNSTEVESALGEPRTAVCPTLCDNGLGEPLCSCSSMDVHRSDQVNWTAICTAFCDSDRYILGGCPSCEASSSHSTEHELRTISRILTTSEGWAAWCSVQCRQGQGGAACNCDRAPFL